MLLQTLLVLTAVATGTKKNQPQVCILNLPIGLVCFNETVSKKITIAFTVHKYTNVKVQSCTVEYTRTLIINHGIFCSYMNSSFC